MHRYAFVFLAAVVLVGATLIPDDAFARRGGGGGGRGGGMHGGMHAGGVHGGGGRHFAGGPRPSHPIAGRPGRPGGPVAGRPGYPGRPIAGRPGYPGRYPGAAWGAAAVGAAAAGAAYGYYNNNNYGCYYDQYGQYVCPNQY